MRRDLDTIESVKNKLKDIVGVNVEIAVNKGRKKITKYDGKIMNIYPSVFTIELNDNTETKMSYSYTEILCGNVKICPKNV